MQIKTIDVTLHLLDWLKKKLKAGSCHMLAGMCTAEGSRDGYSQPGEQSGTT